MHPTVQAALIALGTSILTTVVLRYFVDDHLDQRRVERTFRYEQRRRLREAMGELEGPLLQAVEEFHFRMQNIYRNHGKNWLTNGPGGDGYYFYSTAYRLVAVQRLAVSVERRALYLDPAIRAQRDPVILRYAKSLQIVLASTDLTRGFPYENSQASDHIFQERVRSFADIPIPEGRPFTFDSFEEGLKDHRLARPALSFIEGLSPEKTPLRWDRLVALDLLSMALMSSIGFDDVFKLDQSVLERTVKMFSTKQVPTNLVDYLLPRIGLATEPEVARIASAIMATSRP